MKIMNANEMKKIADEVNNKKKEDKAIQKFHYIIENFILPLAEEGCYKFIIPVFEDTDILTLKKIFDEYGYNTYIHPERNDLIIQWGEG